MGAGRQLILTEPRAPERGREPRRRRFSRLSLIYAAVGAVVTAGWVLFTLHAPPGRLAGSFDDDAFYYFGVARHLAHGQGSTFNGIDTTNGYHPLWLAMLTPIFRVASGRAALVLVRLLEGALFLVSLALLARIGNGLRRPAAMAIGASVLVVMGSAGPAHWFTGMESAVLIPCLLAVVVVFVRTGGLQPEQLGARTCGALGILLAVTTLARLDTVFLVVATVAFTLWRLRGVGRAILVRSAVALAVPPIVTLAVYGVLNEVWFGAAAPVSGQAKALGGPFTNSKPITQFLQSPVFLEHSFWFGFLVLVTVPLALTTTRRDATDGARGLAYGSAVLLVAELLTIAYYSIASSWQLWSWYFLLTDVVLATSVAALLDGSRFARRFSAATLLRVAGAVLATSVAVVGANLYRLDRHGARHAVYIVNSVGLANRLDRTLPRDAVVAMGDRAGALGYALHRPMVQLEGLVSSIDYLDALRNGRVHEFLASHHVSVYIRSSDDPGVPTATAGCTRFTEPAQGGGPKVPIVVCAGDLLVDQQLSDGTYERVWRYLPALNP